MPRKHPKFAEGTTVPIHQTKAEIESLVAKYGANQFASLTTVDKSAIQFVMNERVVRFAVALLTETNSDKPKEFRDRENMRLWRALMLSIKAKLEIVTSGIGVFDREFLSNIVDPKTGQTIGDVMVPAIESSYKNVDINVVFEGGGNLRLKGPNA